MYSLCISCCRSRTPDDRPRPHKRARPVPLFVSFGPRGTSGGPRARRPAAAAAAAAGTAAAAPATRCPRFPLTLGFFGWGFPSGIDAGLSAAAGRPTTGCPAELSAAPRRASRAYVREHAGGTKPTLAVLCPLPALALPSASRYSGGDGGVVDIGVYQATAGLYTRGGGAQTAPGWPRNHPPPGVTPSYGRTNPIPCASPG